MAELAKMSTKGEESTHIANVKSEKETLFGCILSLVVKYVALRVYPSNSK